MGCTVPHGASPCMAITTAEVKTKSPDAREAAMASNIGRGVASSGALSWPMLGRYREACGRPIRQSESDVVTVEDLDGTLTRQSVTIEPGDILLIRIGWVGWYDGLQVAERQALAEARQNLHAPGVAGEEAVAEWFWDHQFAAVACDVPALEVVPSGPWNAPDPVATYEHYLHFRIIPLLGLAVGRDVLLDPLAEDCARDRQYTGLFTSAPLNKTGGAGSTANALAIK